MYAAAGGASLASRKARQNKQKKTHLAQEQAAKAKATAESAGPRVQKSRQFHQLPENYLRTPNASGGQSRKLSAASFAAQSKFLLPIHEGQHPHLHHHRFGNHPLINQHTQYHSHLPSGGHHHSSRLNLHHGRPSAPRLSQDDDGIIIHSHLTKSATASFPLVSQIDATPPATPLITVDNKKILPIGVGSNSLGAELVSVDESLPITPLQPDDDDLTKYEKTDGNLLKTIQATSGLNVLPIPQDSIIVTPATPLASPGHSIKAPSTSSQAAEEKDFFGPGPFQLERKCSFYRVRPRRSNAFETYDDDAQSFLDATGHELTTAQLLHYRDYTDDSALIPHPHIANGGSRDHKYAQCAYCEDGICLCEHIECAQGRAAWLERERIRRCSVQDKDNNTPASCHRKWVKRNRIQDSSLGGSSDDEDLLGVLRGPSNFANAFLYVGLGTVAIGLVIAFVGTGEKGFKTVELRLIGPSLIGIGLICCILRICFCICPSSCISSSRRARKKNSNKVDADHTTSLLRGESKRVSIAKGPSKFPLGRKKSNHKMMNEGMEALRQIATTSLFLQNEQKPATTNRVVPIIKEPEKLTDSPLEMKKLDTTLNISDITDDEDEDDESQAIITPYDRTTDSLCNQNPNDETTSPTLVRTQSKLARKRLSIHQQIQKTQNAQTTTIATSTTSSSSTSSTSTTPFSPTQKQLDADTLLMETSLMIIDPMPSAATAANLSLENSTLSTPVISLKPSDTSKSTILPIHQPLISSSLLKTPGSSSPIPASTTLLSPRSTYDLPSSSLSSALSIAGKQSQKYAQQHTPGQIIDIHTSIADEGAAGGILLPKTTSITSPPSLGSQLILTPSLLPGSIHGSTTGTTNSYLAAIPGPSTSGVILQSSSIASSQLAPPPTLTGLNSEPELVLSPAKLGQ